MTTAIIMQARMTSTRLPGKVLKPLGGMSALRQCLRRCKAVQAADVVVCAVPDSPLSDAMLPEIEAAGALVSRGSELDVMARYADAARMVEADIVIRVTSDCPLIDPDIIEQVLDNLHRGGAPFSTTYIEPDFPIGFDVECYAAQLLFDAASRSSNPEHREHVDVLQALNCDAVDLACPFGNRRSDRLTLDFPEDYAMFLRLFEHLPSAPDIVGLGAVLDIWDAHPEIRALNAMHAK